MQNRGFGFPTIPIGIEIEGAGEGRKGHGLALKLSGLVLVKYQQHTSHTHRGIGILPSLIVKYWTNSFTKM